MNNLEAQQSTINGKTISTSWLSQFCFLCAKVSVRENLDLDLNLDPNLNLKPNLNLNLNPNLNLNLNLKVWLRTNWKVKLSFRIYMPRFSENYYDIESILCANKTLLNSNQSISYASQIYYPCLLLTLVQANIQAKLVFGLRSYSSKFNPRS